MPDLSLSGIPGGLLNLGADPYLRSYIFGNSSEPQPLRVLQVQCSSGLWLENQQRAFGADVELEFFGLEEDGYRLGDLKKRVPGVPIFCEKFANFNFPAAYFHFIYWDATRETSGDPLEFFKWARIYLQPGGCLLMRYYLADRCDQWPLYKAFPDLRGNDLSGLVSLRDLWKLTQAAGFDRSVTGAESFKLDTDDLRSLTEDMLTHKNFPTHLRSDVLAYIRGEMALEDYQHSVEALSQEDGIIVGEVFCLGNAYFGD